MIRSCQSYPCYLSKGSMYLSIKQFTCLVTNLSHVFVRSFLLLHYHFTLLKYLVMMWYYHSLLKLLMLSKYPLKLIQKKCKKIRTKNYNVLVLLTKNRFSAAILNFYDQTGSKFLTQYFLRITTIEPENLPFEFLKYLYSFHIYSFYIISFLITKALFNAMSFKVDSSKIDAVGVG